MTGANIDNTQAEGTTLDVVGIGNALVDVLSHETDEFVAAQGVVKGSMTLVDGDRSAALYGSMGPGVEISGGSAANTMVGVASLGGRAHYLGKVADDQLGRVFAHDLRATGVGYSTKVLAAPPATGCCLILVTPDAQRTMNTFLGASVEFGPEDVDDEIVRSGRILYLEGYLFDPPKAQEAYWHASRIAQDAGRTVSLTLSDSFCVDRHREAFRSLVADHVDLLFANEDEIRALYEVDTFDEAVAMVRKDGATAALTRSAAGSVVVTTDDVIAVPAHPVDQLVDTTGAGDLYASGFLYGLSRGESLETCARLGSLAAAEVIGHLGARPAEPLAAAAEALLRTRG